VDDNNALVEDPDVGNATNFSMLHQKQGGVIIWTSGGTYLQVNLADGTVSSETVSKYKASQFTTASPSVAVSIGLFIQSAPLLHYFLSISSREEISWEKKPGFSIQTSEKIFMEQISSQQVILKSGDGKPLESRQKTLITSISGLPTVFELLHLPDVACVIALIDDTEHSVLPVNTKSTWFSYFGWKSQPAPTPTSSVSTISASTFTSSTTNSSVMSSTQTLQPKIYTNLHGKYVLCNFGGKPIFRLYEEVEECRLVFVFHNI